MPSVRTTLTLDEDVAASLKAESRRSGRPYREIVNEFLRIGLSARRSPPPSHPFRVRAKPMGLRPGLALENIGDLLEQLEGPAHK